MTNIQINIRIFWSPCTP